MAKLEWFCSQVKFQSRRLNRRRTYRPFYFPSLQINTAGIIITNWRVRPYFIRKTNSEHHSRYRNFLEAQLVPRLIKYMTADSNRQGLDDDSLLLGDRESLTINQRRRRYSGPSQSTIRSEHTD